MRGRLAFIVVVIAIAAILAVQNWPEFTRPSLLTLGVIQTSVPLGLALLILLGLTLAVFLVSATTQESRYLMEHRRQQRVLHAQRELAENAEASRYTDLRQVLDTHLREMRDHDAVIASEFEKRVMQGQREMRLQIDRIHHLLASRVDAEHPVVVEPAPARVDPLDPAPLGSKRVNL